MRIYIEKSKQVLVFSTLLFSLLIPIVHSEENSNFEIVNLNIDVSIDAGGLSLITERMILSNTSPEEISSIEMKISGRMIWNLKAFEDENRILPSSARKIDFMLYEIRIDVDIEPGKKKIIWLQYLVDLGIISEKYEDFRYVKITYNFYESKYLCDDNYPFSIRFWAPVEFFVATDAGASISDESGSPFNERSGTFEERDYIFLAFERNPEQKSITVILRDREEIDRFNSELEETLDFSGSTPIMKISGKSVSCIRQYPFFTIALPYRGINHKVIPQDLFEVKSDSMRSWLVPKDNIVYLRVGYPLDYYVEYDVDDKNLRNPFFTIINRDVSEIGTYTLIVSLRKKPYF